MIALNELIDNQKIFEERFTYLGFERDLNEIITLENERKILQLNYEKLRADTNKLCHLLAVYKSHNQNFDETFNQIILNEKQLNIDEIKLNQMNLLINKKLNLLPNLPDEILQNNKLISKNKQAIGFSQLQKFIQDSLKNEYVVDDKNDCVSGSKNCIKPFTNYIFEYNQVLKLFSNNQMIIMLSQIKFDDFIKQLFKYLEQKSMKFWQIKTKSMSRSSSSEFKAKLSDITIKIEIKNEYYTRKYNIKYKNSLEDMTRFLKQINISVLKLNV